MTPTFQAWVIQRMMVPCAKLGRGAGQMMGLFGYGEFVRPGNV